MNRHRRMILFGKKDSLAPFLFDDALTTFTAGMAVRAGALFAGAPMIQGAYAGSGYGDTLSLARGSQVVDYFYDNFDPYQGTIALLWTPEKSRVAAQDYDEYIFYINEAYFFDYQHDQERFVGKIGGQNLLVDHTTVAGTTYAIVIRWDVNNKLDGTNYSCLSINDVHEFDITVQPTASAPDAALDIGHITAPVNTLSANARIENLTVLRYPVFDGTYGIDLQGDGTDVIAGHYNSGNFADMSEVVNGSWDTTLSLPTNATPGALATGAGHAWSHPHSSNLLGVGGFMLDGTYGNDGWADEGTPTAVAALSAAESIFGGGGYKVTSDAANEGIYKDITVSVGDDIVGRHIGYSDGTSVPKVVYWDQDNGAEIGQLTGSTASTRAAPEVFIFTCEAPAGCTTIRIKLINTDATAADITYWVQAEEQDNLLTNPSMVAGAGDPWVPTGWSNINLDAGDTQASSTGGAIIHSGSECIQFNAGAIANERMFSNAIAIAPGTFIGLGGAIYNTIVYKTATNWASDQKSILTVSDLSGTAGVWSSVGMVAREKTGAAQFYTYIYGNSAVGYADDLYAFELDAVSLTATPASEANSAEGTGLRVDGLDTLTQPTDDTMLTATAGTIKFGATARHNPADWAKFGNAEGYLLDMYEDANNYLRVYESAANTMTIAYNAQGAGEVTDDYDATGVTFADTLLQYQVEYGGSGASLRIGGAIVALAAGAVAFATAPTNDLNFGHKNDDTAQFDGVISNPV